VLTPLLSSLSLFTALIYAFAGALFVRHLVVHNEPDQQPSKLAWSLTIGAVILHALVLYTSILQANTIELGITNAASLVTWVIVVLFLIATTRQPIHNLGALIAPISAVTLIMQWLWPASPSSATQPNSPLFGAHLTIALLGYAFLTLAALQATLLMIQERRIQQHHPGRLLHGLPPLQTMDRLLFQLIVVGFVFLSLTIISGVFFTEQIFGAPLVFNHHTVLAIIGWGVFATLLVGRWGFGWRGRKAAAWTLAGFVVLLLGYFGTKFVVEVLRA